METVHLIRFPNNMGKSGRNAQGTLVINEESGEQLRNVVEVTILIRPNELLEATVVIQERFGKVTRTYPIRVEVGS